MIRPDDTAAKSYSPSWGSVRKGPDRRIIVRFFCQNVRLLLHSSIDKQLTSLPLTTLSAHQHRGKTITFNPLITQHTPSGGYSNLLTPAILAGALGL